MCVRLFLFIQFTTKLEVLFLVRSQFHDSDLAMTVFSGCQLLTFKGDWKKHSGRKESDTWNMAGHCEIPKLAMGSGFSEVFQLAMFDYQSVALEGLVWATVGC